jgi:predicted house-cleaning noncanonical NTP pyrophosphatase (MazG superfamily)
MQRKFKEAEKLGLKTPYFMTVTTRMYKDALSTQIQENKLEAEVTKVMEDDNLDDATKYMKMLENNLKSQELVSDFLIRTFKLDKKHQEILDDMELDAQVDLFSKVIMFIQGFDEEEVEEALSSSDDKR